MHSASENVAWWRRLTESKLPAARSDLSLKQGNNDCQRFAWAALDEFSFLAFAVVSGNGRILLKVNAAFAQLHGFTVEALTGASIHLIVKPEDRRSLDRHLLHANAAPHYIYEIDHIRNGGMPFHAQINVSLMFNSAFAEVCRTILVQDISERKVWEADVRASEARYRAMVESSSDFIYETDSTGLFSYTSIPAGKKFLGYSETELRNLSLLDLVHPSYRPTVAASYRQKNDLSTPSYQEFPVCSKGGDWVWIGQKLTTISANPLSLRHIGSAKDVTESKRSNARRRKGQIELEDLQDWYVATQTTVALAHELNQPLNAVSSYNEAALRMLNSGNPFPDKLQHALTSSVQQSERAGKVMRDLIAFLVKGHHPLAKEALDINVVVRQTLVDMSEEARAGEITLVTDLCESLRPIFAHRLHIEKVLCNLLRNSVEAILGSNLAHGTITVTTAYRGEFALVTVSDSGPGFSIGQVEKILEPFNTSKKRGVGMGLPVSRALVEAHGGKLWAETGGGPVFCFTVPFAR